MRATALLLVPLLAAGLGVAGCTFRQAPPPPAPAPVVPTTAWTAELTASTVTPLVEALLADGWSGRFREANGRAPVIAVQAFADRSDDHVPVDDLAAAFRQALAGSDRVQVATGDVAGDVALVGVIGLAAADYTIDARITDAKSAETLWVTGILRPKP